MAVKTQSIVGKRGPLEVFRTSVSIPTAELSIPPFPPSLGSLPAPQPPRVMIPDVSVDTGTPRFNLPNGTDQVSFPSVTKPNVPTPNLMSPPFPPSLGSVPTPKAPILVAPAVGVVLNNNLNAPGGKTLPALTTPSVPSPGLTSPPFPPSLGSLPAPALPELPTLPTLAVQGLSLPYMTLPLPGGGDAMTSPLIITVEG